MSNPNENNEAVDLSALDEGWEEAKPAEGGGEVPDGKYSVFVEKVAIRKSQGGNPYLNWQLRVVEGEHAGRVLFSRTMLTKENQSYTKRDLEYAGLKLSKLSELSKHLDELLDAKMVVQKRTKGEFVDVYLSKKTGTMKAEEKAALAEKRAKAPTGGSADGESLLF